MDPARFVFIDETGTATNMARRYGRGPLGERLVAAVPQGHWQTTTLIAGLKQSGIVAPLVLVGPITGPAFRAYVEQFLAPALAPGDVVFFGAKGPRSKPAQVDHMGIAVGNGWMVHSSSSGTTLVPLTGWYRDRFAWARRPLAEAGLEAPQPPG